MGGLGQFLVGGGFVALISTLVTYLLARPKARQEAASIAAKTAADTSAAIDEKLTGYINRLEERIKNLETRNDSLDAENERLNAENRSQRGQIEDLQRGNGVLRGQMDALTTWATTYYEAGHPPGMNPPPIFINPEGGKP